MSRARRPHAELVLEFPLVLELLASHCESEIGANLALELAPSYASEKIAQLIKETSEADSLLASGTAPSINNIRDISASVSQMAKGATGSGETLYQVGVSLSCFRRLKRAVLAKESDLPALTEIAQILPENSNLENLLLQNLDGDGSVRDSASAALASARAQVKSITARIAERIQQYTTGKYRTLLSDPIYTLREGRYVLPVKSENRGKVKGIVHDTSASGQTIFVEPEEIVQMGNSLREAVATERDEINRILAEYSSRVGSIAGEINSGSTALSRFDLIFAKVRYGWQMEGCLPQLVTGHFIRIKKGRHPLLDPEIVVPLDFELGSGNDVVVITGPNTGGKTIAIKTVGLITLMAQCGMIVPASELRIGPFSQVWADIGDEQSIEQSLSTFSGHIKNISEAIQKLEHGGLVLLDEVGAGTDPAEGAALAKAILATIQERGGKVLASSHFGELKLYAANAVGVTNGSMEFDLKTFQPTYRFLMGMPGASHAFRIAERYGLPKSVVELASADSGVQEQEVSQMLQKLEHLQKQAQRAQGEADKLSHRLRESEREYELKLEKAEEARRRANERANDQIAETLRELRLQASDIFDQLKRDPRQENIQAAREKLSKMQEQGEKKINRNEKPKAESLPQVVKGSTVRIASLSSTGIVLEEPKGDKVSVQVGAMKMVFPLRQLELVQDAKPVIKKSTGAKTVTGGGGSYEISIRGMSYEDAEEALSKFLDAGLLAGYPFLRIVHGKGEGILRKMTHDMLRRHSGVRKFEDAEPAEGGSGVTIASLK